MYRDSQTQIRCADGLGEPFYVTVGLHQDSTLSLLLFIIIMDCLMEKTRRGSPWDMMFADMWYLAQQERKQRVKRNGGIVGEV